ncbi:Uncharacterised protein [Mobiluncus mulieris]|nr:Uncharacterised protein [Mobiluncus mulieris]
MAFSTAEVTSASVAFAALAPDKSMSSTLPSICSLYFPLSSCAVSPLFTLLISALPPNCAIFVTSASLRSTTIRSLFVPLAPTWKRIALEPEAEPSNSLVPLKLVTLPIRSNSERSCFNSALILPRDFESFESLAPWTASTRIRCKMECTSFNAPSAVWITEMPSWALRTAWRLPPTWERKPSEIARPAASSAARLIRKPEESFSRDFANPTNTP